MRREHCRSKDSLTPFCAKNYGTETTSVIEWWFVADPELGLKELDLQRWPLEQLLRHEHSQGNMMHAKTRRPDPPAAFEQRRHAINEALEMHGGPLFEEEVIAGRLYTGPVFIKYNCVLRGVETAHRNTIPRFLNEWRALCQGNKYTTTIHCIASCIVKCSKLTQCGTVYRGLSGGVLPDAFWHSDEYNVRGGCEYSFLSTSLERSVALEYAAHRKCAATVFEINMGATSRGAHMEWLSQCTPRDLEPEPSSTHPAASLRLPCPRVARAPPRTPTHD